MNYLRHYRRQAKLTQAQAAKFLKLSQGTVASHEIDRRRVSADQLSHYADLYGCTTDALLGRDVQPTPPDPIITA